MTQVKDRNMKKVFTRTPKGKAKIGYKEEKKHKNVCAVSGKKLHGVPQGLCPSKVGKLAKTEKRPSVRFGGVLGGGSRKKVVEEALKVREGIKSIDSVSFKLRNFVKQELERKDY